MSQKWYPVINYETCIECGKCINMCPHHVYDKNQTLPKVINPLGCIENCRKCANRCPTQSIEYAGDVRKTAECGCNGESSSNCKEDEEEECRCDGDCDCQPKQECGCHENTECECREENCGCENNNDCSCKEEK
ncbi:MAG: 4Fe-4S binding protein [Candidatus Izemoplasmatales bacterium]